MLKIRILKEVQWSFRRNCRGLAFWVKYTLSLIPTHFIIPNKIRRDRTTWDVMKRSRFIVVCTSDSKICSHTEIQYQVIQPRTLTENRMPISFLQKKIGEYAYMISFFHILSINWQLYGGWHSYMIDIPPLRTKRFQCTSLKRNC